jgi:hypothetical protein
MSQINKKVLCNNFRNHRFFWKFSSFGKRQEKAQKITTPTHHIVIKPHVAGHAQARGLLPSELLIEKGKYKTLSLDADGANQCLSV